MTDFMSIYGIVITLLCLAYQRCLYKEVNFVFIISNITELFPGTTNLSTFNFIEQIFHPY